MLIDIGITDCSRTPLNILGRGSRKPKLIPGFKSLLSNFFPASSQRIYAPKVSCYFYPKNAKKRPHGSQFDCFEAFFRKSC